MTETPIRHSEFRSMRIPGFSRAAIVWDRDGRFEPGQSKWDVAGTGAKGVTEREPKRQAKRDRRKTKESPSNQKQPSRCEKHCPGSWHGFGGEREGDRLRKSARDWRERQTERRRRCGRS